MNAVSPSLLTAIVLAAAAAAGCVRLLRRHAPVPHVRAQSRVRLALLLLAQPALAALLYLGMFPPQRPTSAGAMTVLTAGARATRTPADGLRIAMPEAPAGLDAEAAPDLATALRRHPGITHLRIVGAGLEARDREAAAGRALAFDALAPVPGIVALAAPATVAAGNAFTVQGRVAGLPQAQVELLDPAGRRAAHAVASGDGRFALQATVRAAGPVMFQLRLRDAGGAARETLPLPLQVIVPSPPRLLVLAGAPDPELKYLRRWAVDAGMQLHTRISVGAGLVQGDAPVALDAGTLHRFDALLLDVRSLEALHDGEVRALTAAVRNGLGLMLRIERPLPGRVRSRLRGWGYTLEGDARVQPMQLASSASAAAAGATPPPISRHALRAGAIDAVPLLRNAAHDPVAWWRPLGRGRVGLTVLDDSFRLPLAGHADVHARLWSGLVAAIARTAERPAGPSLAGPAWAGQRAVVCGLSMQASLVAPDGAVMPLAVDPATGGRGCAAFWPRQAGWYRLQPGNGAAPFAVLPASSGLAWQAQRRVDATRALVARAATAPPAARTGPMRRGSPWPWLSAWLLVAALTWWLERHRPGALPS